MNRRQTRYTEFHLGTSDTTANTKWFTGWMPTIGVDQLRFLLKVKNATGANFQSQVVLQTAAVRIDAPNASVAIGTAKTGNTEYNSNALAVRAYTNGAAWFRLGVQYTSLAGLPTLNQADVGLQSFWLQYGFPISSQRVQFDANNTGARVAVLTPWLCREWFTNITVAIVVNGVTPPGGLLSYQLVSQTAATSIQNPAAWDTSFASAVPFTTNTETNTSEIPVPSGSIADNWFRIGVSYSLSSGTMQTSAIFNALVCGRA